MKSTAVAHTIANQIATIPLTQGRTAVVDAADYADLVQFSWYYDEGYAVRSLPRELGKPRQREKMHRRIMGLTAGDSREVDHDDHDGLNNRRRNLRVCAPVQNQQNSRRRCDNTSGFKGVSRAGGRWQATISINKKQRYLGLFETPELANEFAQLARELAHGEYACHG